MKRILSNVEDVGRWIAKKTFGTWEGQPTIGLESGGNIVAGVLYDSWNGRSIMCHIAIEEIMTPAYLGAIFHYPFLHLGCDKIIGSVAESNADIIRFVKKLGFQEEARILDAHPDGSLLLYTMKREQCRFIGDRYGKRLIATASA